MSLPLGFIPDELDYNTYMLEYIPGTYGDFVCSIISYSVEDYFDPLNPLYTEEDEYWKISGGTVMLRKQYPLSCRGGGYEHIEKYSEFMLAHKIFLDYPALLTNPTKVSENLLFNTHMRLDNNGIVSKELSRTLTNTFTKTQIKCLTIDTSFDSILMSACNEHYTSTEEEILEPNWKRIYGKFAHRLYTLDWIRKNVPEDKIFDIGNILNLNPDTISSYGKVNEEKFEKYLEEYKEQKLHFLHFLLRKRRKEIFANQELKDLFVTRYEKFNDKSNDQ